MFFLLSGSVLSPECFFIRMLHLLQQYFKLLCTFIKQGKFISFQIQQHFNIHYLRPRNASECHEEGNN